MKNIDLLAKYLIIGSTLVLQIPVTQTQAPIVTDDDVRVIESTFIKPVQKDFPDRTSNYQQMIKEKERLEAERLEALRLAQEAEAARQAQVSTPAPTVVSAAPKTSQNVSGGNGYIVGGFNCVECVKRLTGRSQNGNAGQWAASTSTPYVGAVMIFYGGEQGASGAGHVAVVTGVNGDGTVSVAHCNWGGGQTRFRSTGKFW